MRQYSDRNAKNKLWEEVYLHTVNNWMLLSEAGKRKQNQSVIEREIRTLIEDNQKLSQQVGVLLKEKLDNSRKSKSNDNSKEVENLRRQISFLIKERDSLNVLWQTSQRTVEALETELKTYQGYEGGSAHFNAYSTNELELKLETALNDYIALEKKYKELNSCKTDVEKDVKSKNQKILDLKAQRSELENKILQLSRNVEESKVHLELEVKNNENLKKQLEQCQKDCMNYLRKEAEAKSKVAEALQLFDMVTTQRDEAYKKVSETSEELTRLQGVLAKVELEAEKRFAAETDEMKNKYNEKISDMLNHIRNLDAELVEKGLVLTKMLRENKILRATNERYLKKQTQSEDTVDPRLTAAEQRLEAMYNELVCSERRNIQLASEKQQLILDLRRQQDWHARESRRRDWEEKILTNSQEELKRQVEDLRKSLEDTHAMIDKLQNMLISRTEQNHRIFSNKEEELAELNKHIQKQMELNKKWKESYVDMTAKLKKRLEELEAENKKILEEKTNSRSHYDTRSLDNKIR